LKQIVEDSSLSGNDKEKVGNAMEEWREEKKQVERKTLLGKKIDDLDVREIVDMFVDFLSKNRSNGKILTIEQSLAKASSENTSINDLIVALQ